MLVGGVVAAGAYYGHCKGASGPKDDVAFTVEPGTSGEEVVRSSTTSAWCGAVGSWGGSCCGAPARPTQIRAGSYTLTTNMTFDEALARAVTPPPPVPTARLTIPEGYRLTQIAERVHEALGIPQDRFLTAAQGTDWSLAPYLPTGKGTEGFLFPETYRFAKDATSKEIIQRLLDQFDTEAKGSTGRTRRTSACPTTRSSSIASMIEREARVPSDRAKISAVIYNRLAERDAARDRRDDRLHRPDPSNGLTVSDFEIDSPYNTRLHAGLPPTPIASPGIASLRAALHPADVPYLYYVLCSPNGAHRFSVSYDQFLSDKAECLG